MEKRQMTGACEARVVHPGQGLMPCGKRATGEIDGRKLCGRHMFIQKSRGQVIPTAKARGT